MSLGPATRRESKAALFGVLTLLCLGILGLMQAWSLGLWLETAPGPGLFPAAISAVLITCCLATVLSEWRGISPADSVIEDDEGSDVRRLVGYSLALALYVVALEPLGYLLATGAVFVLLLRFAERLSWTRTLSVTAAALLLCDLLFVRLLGVTLPTGRVF